MSSCNSSVVDRGELVERWYKVENGEEEINREVFWENFDKKIPAKIVEYMLGNSIYIEYYSDSLLRTSILIDDSEKDDTLSTLHYQYDDFNNVSSYIEIEDGIERLVKSELTLDSKTHKPTSYKTISPSGSSITRIQYFPDHEVSKTYINGDSLILYSAKYFDYNRNKIGEARKHFMYSASSSDSTFYKYEENRLVKVTKYHNGSLIGHKAYYYENDTLKKVVDQPINKKEVIYIIKYSKK